MKLPINRIIYFAIKTIAEYSFDGTKWHLYVAEAADEVLLSSGFLFATPQLREQTEHFIGYSVSMSNSSKLLGSVY